MNQKVAPRPGILSTPMVPLIASTRCLTNREAKAGAAHVARPAAVDAIEALEEARQVAWLDAGAGVGDLDAQGVPFQLCVQADLRARAAILDRVVEQVGEDLLERLAIGARRRQVERGSR